MILLKAFLAGCFALVAVLLLEQYVLLTREPFNRRECEEYLQTEYGGMIQEARRQVWVNDVEARLQGTEGKE